MNERKEKIKSHNSDIFNEIYLKTQKFSLKELDELFDLPLGAMQKITKKIRFLTQAQILVLESHYDIPSEVFNNLDISPSNAIKRIKIYEEKQNKNKIVVFNNYPLTIKAFNQYKYFYIYDSEINRVIERKLDIDGNQIKMYIIQNDNKKTLNFEGSIFTTASSIVMVVENPITGNSIVFKVQRNAIVGEVVPITYLGHRTVTGEETANISFCSKHRINNDKVINILDLDLKEFNNFSKRKNEIVRRLKDYETKCKQNK